MNYRPAYYYLTAFHMPLQHKLPQ